jgi:hypothetical protein
LLYRDASVQAQTGPAGLSQEECIDRATSFLVGNKIVGPDEVKVDSIIRENYMVTADGKGSSNDSQPQVARYTVVFKRNIGELPILTNDADTIRVEIGRNGKIASLISRYKYGRKVSRLASMKGALASVRQATTTLSATGDIKNVRAGMLPMSDGTYLPVYEVASVTFPDGLLPRPQITYRRMDTLQIVDKDAASAGDVSVLESDEATPEMDR